ncbi:MAG: glycosyltransferase family 2 protein [Desulfobacterales bacterium]
MPLQPDPPPGGDRRSRFAFVIPVYNHEQTVADVVRRAMVFGWPVVVVDDGSTDDSFGRIKGLPGVRVLRHRANRGKGAALLSGFAKAAELADWAITLDADGQHDPEDARALVHALPQGGRPILVGRRTGMQAEAGVPWTSRFGRGFSNFWLRAAGGPAVADSQSGFRIYPLPECMQLGVKAQRFQFEIEILAKAAWKGMQVLESPVSVSYRPGTPRISHFHPFFDFMRNFVMFSRLITFRVLTLKFIRD